MLFIQADSHVGFYDFSILWRHPFIFFPYPLCKSYEIKLLCPKRKCGSFLDSTREPRPTCICYKEKQL